MQVGIPSVLSFFYYLPFYKTFLERLDCQAILSKPTSAKTLENLTVCPTDEPCISVKLAFPHVRELIEKKVDHLFIPTLVSRDRFSYYCPKHIGLPAMLRNGLDVPPGFIITPQINWRDNARSSIGSLCAAGKKLGASEKRTMEALKEAWQEQNRFNRTMAERGLTVPEALEMVTGIKRFKRKSPFNPLAQFKENLRVGVVGHSYVLYDYIGHNVIDRLKEHAAVLTPEMVLPRSAAAALESTSYGRELWSFEQVIVGSALHWLRNRMIDCLILFGPFECGPEAVIEVFLEEEVDKHGVPLLILTVDEQTGEAGLVTRLEAFLDTVPEAVRYENSSGRPEIGARQPDTAPGQKVRFIPPPMPERRVLGFPTLGKLGGALATIFSGELVNAIGPLPITRLTTEYGAELAPEFICYPLTVTIGQMRQCLEAGANTLVMVGGKGRCRLGWYAEMQEMLLKRAGYDFEMLVINSPLPLHQNFKPFIGVVREFMDMRLRSRVLSSALLAFYKAALTEKAEERLYTLRARESRRGLGDSLYRRFLQEAREASSLGSLKKVYRGFRQECDSIPLVEGEPPFKVRLIGEIYAVFEDYVNHEIARSLGSLEDVRIEVEREVTVINWFRHHILHSPSMLRRQRRIISAARPYLSDQIGGHGLESVGLTALAPHEGVDGLLHLWPFTCMPEIIAQSILTRVVRELEIPLLTVIINEQTGEAGLQTRVESFSHILRERRKEREVLLK